MLSYLMYTLYCKCLGPYSNSAISLLLLLFLALYGTFPGLEVLGFGFCLNRHLGANLCDYRISIVINSETGFFLSLLPRLFSGGQAHLAIVSLVSIHILLFFF